MEGAECEVGGGYSGGNGGKVQRARLDPWLKGNWQRHEDGEKGEELEERESQVGLLSGGLSCESDLLDA